MGLATARDGIVTALDTISGLTVIDHMADQFSELPAVAIRFKGANYTDATFTFSLLLIASGWDVDETELSLHGFLDSVGSESLKLAMDTYAGCTVVSAGPIKRRKIGGIDHLTAELEVVTCVV
ncbi:MAG: hypothetical protein HOJ22_08365 [Chloroflexi bacterium]|jgi:hypothetical protein|nr:hypothetical protein [Chloroflexota bacterium]MBT5628291.1 hypothetical protein [Chloroflexota bacterium]